jgi:two-component system, LytTR family, response regulator
MLTCIVVDDERHAIKVMEAHIKATPLLEHLASFTDAVEALTWLASNKTDLIFLDINMPRINGMELAKAAKGKAMVIFCTAYPEFAAASYELEVVDYLLKPIEYLRFFQAVEKALKLSGASGKQPPITDTGFLMVKNGGLLFRIDFNSIVYLAAKRNYTKIQLTTHSTLSLILLKDILKKLPPDQFVRVHHSYIIAINKIERLDANSVWLKHCESPIPISDTYRPDLLKMIHKTG